ncbi:MAG: hypothetical protein J7M21_05650, partial [Planctomycetes bacterium]|nr:hypothetical protein [Planctomycetota bacterium]
PAEAGRPFVVAVHRLMRRLDDDPYTDALWGILTGYTAADALRIATETRPLVIRRAAAGTAIDLGPFDAGEWFSETQAGLYCLKVPGGEPRREKGPPDSTAAIVKLLNGGKVDLFITSGHATQHDWQIGYSYRGGQFRCRGGRLVAIDRAGRVLPIRSPNPKVYVAAGNCLIGDITGRDCMALAWLGESGGARQMVGYTVSTWYGAMGWGTKDRLLDLPGRYNLAEAFYFTNQELIRRLHEQFPKQADADIDRFDLESNPALLGRCLKKLGIGRFDRRARDLLGMLWDRDTVAFYGDPAWDARLARRKLPLATTLNRKGRTWTFELRAERTCKPKKPLAMLLPRRLADVKITGGRELRPVITDNFIMLMNTGPFEAGKAARVTFTARPASP